MANRIFTNLPNFISSETGNSGGGVNQVVEGVKYEFTNELQLVIDNPTSEPRAYTLYHLDDGEYVQNNAGVKITQQIGQDVISFGGFRIDGYVFYFKII